MTITLMTITLITVALIATMLLSVAGTETKIEDARKECE